MPVLVTAFVLFRFFDIVKPFGIKKCELLMGAWGIMSDDIISGLLSGAIIRIFLLFGWLSC